MTNKPTSEDAGLLVHAVADDRHRLIDQALSAPDPRDREAVGNAVALFRGRAATREHKRGAVAALARVRASRTVGALT